jgi:hypothetical protein
MAIGQLHFGDIILYCASMCKKTRRSQHVAVDFASFFLTTTRNPSRTIRKNSSAPAMDDDEDNDDAGSSS